MAKAKTIKIRQTKSAIGEPVRIVETLRALGLRHQRVVEKPDDPAIRGMIAKVHHLVKVEDA